MSDEQIFELMKKHFRLCPIHDIAYIEWIAETEDVLRFARAIRQNGYDEGYNEGYDSSTISSKMNMWEEE